MNCEAVHCRETATVRFALYPEGFDGPRILARISDEALRHHWGAGSSDADLLLTCQAHFPTIEKKALQRLRSGTDSLVLLTLADFETPLPDLEEAPHI
jgi:hypothetical protein